MKTTIITRLLAVATASANVLESLYAVPEGWVEVGKPAASTQLKFRVAMTIPDEAGFEKALYDMSNPQHMNYGKHLSRDELNDMLRPSSEATDAVVNWLKNNHAQDVKEDGDWISFVASVQVAEAMLNTTFATYRHTASNTDVIRTLKYSIPNELHQYIDMIQPTTRFGQLHPEFNEVLTVETLGKATGVLGGAKAGAASNALSVTACNMTITPECLKDLYNIDGYTLTNESSGFAAFNNFLKEYPRYSDLATFEQEYAPYAIGESFTWESIDGGLLTQNDTLDDSGEANLDVQYLLSVGFPVPIHAYSTAGIGPLKPDLDQPYANMSQNEPYLDFLTYILAQPDEELPHTLTTSYGEDEQSVPFPYRKRVCNMFGQLGARGVSIIFSSGDTGVGSACQTNDGKNTTRFLPIFPAACPYVTSVGGTTGVEPERAVHFSSGGFSDTWARPSYQDKAVSGYFDILDDQWEGLYNPDGRGFPDVAAQGYRFHVVNQGEDQLISGTSASSPAFGGVIALLNGLRIQAGMAPLGFLNPWIYSTAYTALNDILDGGSTGCTGHDQYSGLSAPKVPFASWNATTGWDPVTGYGTPDFSKLLPLAMNASAAYGTSRRT